MAKILRGIGLLPLLLALSCSGLLVGCNKPSSNRLAVPVAIDVIGLTEPKLRAKYPEVAELDNSFSILVSKNLHPYQPPAGNKLLRFGSTYVVAELKAGRVIALHRVRG